MSRSVIWARPLSDNALLTQHDGLSHMAEVVRILLNEAMKVEQAQALHAEPYERSAERRGYANGFKPKTVSTRLGRMQVAIPQVRGEVEFYPSALERGVRSERALKLVVAEMYVQGVSTRKVTEVMQQLCGLEVSSTQVSRVTQLLEEELSAWRDRPLGPNCPEALAARRRSEFQRAPVLVGLPDPRGQFER